MQNGEIGSFENPLKGLARQGQSVWLDDISRGLVSSGELARLIKDDGVAGITSNPVIFEHSIRESRDYDSDIDRLRERGVASLAAYETLVLQDIRMAAEAFRPLYDGSGGQAGFVSLEVSPHLARDVSGTIEEARRLWRELDRPNVFIKVPGTREGLTAIGELTAEGINVNVTLLFSVARYLSVADAYMRGLERRVGNRQPIDRLRSVASFFLSRIDAAVDPRLREARTERASLLTGRTATACAAVAFAAFKTVTSSARWQEISRRGGAPQKLLWASTGTKDPAYSDVKYVEELVSPDTIITLPRKTLDAFREHGRPAPALERNLAAAQEALKELPAHGIDLDAVSDELEEQGIRLFVEAFDKLQATLRKRLGASV